MIHITKVGTVQGKLRTGPAALLTRFPTGFFTGSMAAVEAEKGCCFKNLPENSLLRGNTGSRKHLRCCLPGAANTDF